MKSFIYLIVLLIAIINCHKCNNILVRKYVMRECGRKNIARKEKKKWIIGCGISDEDYSITKKRIVEKQRESSDKIASWEMKKLKEIIEPELNQYIKKNNKSWKPHEFSALCIYGLKNSIKDIFNTSGGNKKKIESLLPSPEKEIFIGKKTNF